MINLPVIQGETYTIRDHYNDFVEQDLQTGGFELENLGQSSDPDLDIYGFWVESQNKPVMYLQGGIHGGTETASTHWVLRFAKILRDNDIPQISDYIASLRARYSFYIMPCANPYGYNNQRQNANDRDLNRDFHNLSGTAPTQPESQIIVDKVTEIKAMASLDIHTMTSQHPIAFGAAIDNQIQIARDIGKSTILNSYRDRLSDVESDDWGYYYPHQNWERFRNWHVRENFTGRQPLAILMEVSRYVGHQNANTSFDDKTLQTKIALNGIFNYLVYTDLYFTNQKIIHF